MSQEPRMVHCAAPRSRFNAGSVWTVRLAPVLVLALGLSSAVHAADYDEFVDGDLSGDPANPTPLAIDAGSNSIRGGVTDNPLDRDIVTLNVPAGLEITAIELTDFQLITASFDGGMLVALEPGSQITDFNSSAALRGFVIAGVAPGTEVGDDLLDDLGGAPLDAGAWTLWFQNTGSVTEYQLTVTAQAAAAPPTAPVQRTAPVPTLGKLGLLALLLGVGWVAARAFRSAG